MPDRNLETKWLEDFLTVCKTRSFSRAADERCVTQSALSRRIRALEEWVGLELVQRNAYPLTLTREGKQFQETAADLIDRLSRARDRIAGGRPIEGGELAFAVVHTLSILFFPRWLSRFVEHAPGISVSSFGTNIFAGAEELLNGRCDFLLCLHHPCLEFVLDQRRLEYTRVGKERVLPVCVCDKRGTPLFRMPTAEEASPVQLLAHAPGTFFGRVFEWLAQNGPRRLEFHPVFESDRPEAIKGMALAGHGVGWLPESLVTDELRYGHLSIAGGEEWTTACEIRLYRATQNRVPDAERVWHYATQPARKTMG